MSIGIGHNSRKTSKPRKQLDKFAAGYDRVFGKDHRPAPTGLYIWDEQRNEHRLVTEAALPRLRKPDSKNIRSFASGINPDQIPEFERDFGHLGVRYDPDTGDAIYKDRQSKLAVLEARGFIDRDEVRGGKSRPVQRG